MLREFALRPAWHAVFNQRVGGLDYLEEVNPPFLLACNHLSIFDPGPVMFALPRRLRSKFATTAMWEHFPPRRTGRIEYFAGIVGLDLVPLVQTGDWRPTLRIAGRVADRGGCPLIFPEGARSSDGELGEFRPGVAVMARELHLPIVPCAAAGTLAVLPIGARWPRRCWFERATIAIHFGEVLAPPRPEEDPAIVVERLRSRIRGLLADSRKAAGRF
jgi:long-chain acyl-CoA synthetase